MKKDQGFFEYIRDDVMSGIDGITSRAMFGGWGFYKYGKIFGLIADGKLYFKVDDSNKAEYMSYGSKPFEYYGKKGKAITMSYWEVPSDILEDREELEEWIEKSVSIQNKK
jgi:DNA transformation protein and related proteins